MFVNIFKKKDSLVTGRKAFSGKRSHHTGGHWASIGVLVDQHASMMANVRGGQASQERTRDLGHKL